MTPTEISILGCGWLGLPLAKVLAENGFLVKGSTTSESKIPVLKSAGINPFLVTLSANEVQGDISGFLSSEILIIDIPPKATTGNFTDKIKKLVPFIENSKIEKVLFISSTSVYGDYDEFIDEHTIPSPETESGKQLLETEQLLLCNTNFRTTILRFGGLIGEDRHPVKFLSGKQNLENPDAPVNLIHRDDCIGIVLKIIETGNWSDTFNAVAPFHPSRKKYYTQKALEMNLPLPEFAHSGHSGKTIDSKRITEVLGYEFQKPSL
jgi:nucleoside-diphosphate-sugar epimerase